MNQPPVVDLCMEPLDLSVTTSKSSHHVHKSTPKLSFTSVFDKKIVSNMLNNRLITHHVASKTPLSLSSISSDNSILPPPAHNNYDKNNYNWHTHMDTLYSHTQEKSVSVICTPDINLTNDSRLSSPEPEYFEAGSKKTEIHKDCNPDNVESISCGLSKHLEFYSESGECNKNVVSFKCNSCDKVYKSAGALKLHALKHSLPYKCDICGKSFSRPWILEGHKRVHTGEKPFKCQNCDRGFADKSNLRCHMQTHATVKKYLCSNCNKSYARKDALRRHHYKKCSLDVN